MTEIIKTLKVRIKDKHAKVLSAMAREINMVWNYCNEVSMKAASPYSGKPKWLTGFDLNNLVSGATKEGLTVHSQTVQEVCEEYAVRRKQFKKHKLNWRVSNLKSSKRSLGWVPFKTGAAVYKNGQIRYAKKIFSLWDSYGLKDYELCAGSFNEDSRGRWYLNVTVKIPEFVGPVLPVPSSSIGIDLGLKEAAVASDGQRIEGRFYRKLEKKLGIAQRAKKKDRVKAIHAKIANQRKDMLHKFSTAMVRDYGAIFVGNVSSKKMVKTKMAKSTLDAGWSSLKTMLEYKSHEAGIVFEEVNEAYTTQTCSCCGAVSGSSPKGRAGLGIREWTCGECGAVHDRDINAAKNILALGHERLAGGIPVLTAQAAASS